MKQLGSHWTDFHEIFYFSIFQKSVEKIQVPSKSDKIKGHITLHKDQYTFLIIFLSIPLRMKNVSDESCTETQNTHFMVE